MNATTDDDKKNSHPPRLSPSLLKSDYDDTKEDDYGSFIPYYLNVTTPKTQKTPVKYENPFKKSPQYLSSNDLGTPDPTKTETSTYVDSLPSAPRDLQALIVSNRFVTLSWLPPLQTNGEILSYSVYYRQEGSQRWGNHHRDFSLCEKFVPQILFLFF